MISENTENEQLKEQLHKAVSLLWRVFACDGIIGEQGLILDYEIGLFLNNYLSDKEGSDK